jgi:hypothetical protein
MIYESLGAVWAVECNCHTWQQFVDDFWVSSGCFGCRIHAEPVTAVSWWFMSPYGLFGLSNATVTRDSSSLMINESLGAVWAVESNCHPWQVFVDDFWVPRAVWAVECTYHPRQQFVDDFWVPRAIWAVDSMRHPSHQFVYDIWLPRRSFAVEFISHPWQHLVDNLWVPRGCFGCRMQLSHVTAVRWWFLSP